MTFYIRIGEFQAYSVNNIGVALPLIGRIILPEELLLQK